MLRKSIKLFGIFIALFCCKFNVVNAYDFKNTENENLVNDMISQIYDTKDQYEDLVGDYEIETIVIHEATSTSYWWPIGSSETTEVDGKLFATGIPETIQVSSPYGYRNNPFTGEKQLHSGIDIAGGSGAGNVNIIAARDGIVVYPTSGAKTDCPFSNPNSDSDRKCGGYYGNYIIIQHSDGNYTLYAHLHAGTITVKEGDSVKQGQVIGKMGSSGNSTGPHLHFEVRKGTNAYSSTVDPSTYISAENPREVFTGGVFLEWLDSWEGKPINESDTYKVLDIGDGVRTVGGGVTLENNSDRFLSHGINIDDYPTGSEISKDIVDQIQLEILAYIRSYIENVLSTNSLTLSEHQIQSLTSKMYNCGNINGFVKAYTKYGNTPDLKEKWFLNNTNKGSQFEDGLTRRRSAEWTLFNEEKYVYNR